LTRAVSGLERRENEGSKRAAPAGVLATLRYAFAALKARWKLFLLLWAIISAVLLILVLLLPRDYEQTAIISVTPVQSDLQAQLGQPPLDPAQANTQALALIKATDLGPVTAQPAYDPASGQQGISVQLKSENRQALKGTAPKLVGLVEEGFRATYERSLGASLQSKVASLDSQIAGFRETVSGLEDQIKDTNPTGPNDIRAVVRLSVLENSRQQTLAQISGLEEQKKTFEEARGNLPRLASEPIKVKVAGESPVSEANRRLPAAAFAVVLSLFAAAASVLWLSARGR
jgi:hypothetical protein